MSRPWATPRQTEILEILNDNDGAVDEWGTIWKVYSGVFQRFDQVTDACVRKGFVEVHPKTGRIKLTSLGGEVIQVPEGD